MRSKYLGFTFLKERFGEWKVKPTNEKKKKLKKKLSEYLKRGKAIARPLVVTIKRVNEIVRGWINYFQNRIDEAVCGRAWTMAETQNTSDCHEAMEEAEKPSTET